MATWSTNKNPGSSAVMASNWVGDCCIIVTPQEGICRAIALRDGGRRTSNMSIMPKFQRCDEGRKVGQAAAGLKRQWRGVGGGCGGWRGAAGVLAGCLRRRLRHGPHVWGCRHL